jgi:hypothetical protein
VTSRVKLPDGAHPPLRVFVNGVRQEEGKDFRIVGRELHWHDRLLKKEGKIGWFRWTTMFLGLVGTYKQNDSVDVHWTQNGKDKIAVYLDIEHDDPPQP